MKTLSMYGASDDLIEIEGIEGADEYYPNVTGKDPYMAAFTVKSASQPLGLIIHVIYGGGWCFAVQPTEDSDGDWCEFPDWPIRRRWGGGNGYSELLEIDVPDDAVVKQIER